MTYPILPQPDVRRTVLSRVRDYLSSMPSLQSEPVRISLCQKQAVNANPLADPELKEIKYFQDFHVMSVVFHDEESTENVATFDATKIRVSDRLFRTVTLAGFMFDGPAPGAGNRHRGHSNWLRFYEKARFSQIAGTNKIVKIVIHGITLFGAFVTNSISHAADTPGMVNLTVSFVCSRVKLPINFIPQVEGTDFYGKMTYEGLAFAGVIGPINYAPSDVIFNLVDPVEKTKAAVGLYLSEKRNIPDAVKLPAIPPDPPKRGGKATVSSFKVLPS